MSHEKPARVRLAELRAEGAQLDLVWGSDYLLTVDLDTLEAKEQFIRRFQALEQQVPGLQVVSEWTSRGGFGRHVVIQSQKRIGYQTRAALQAFLGSDPLREMLGYFDVNNQTEDDPFVLFRPVKVKAIPKFSGAF